MVRKIVESVPDEQLHKDLEKYRQRAIELGATDAKIITTDMVVIDERVLAKCRYPKCRYYGTNANCPPYGMDLELVRKIVNNFRRNGWSRGKRQEVIYPHTKKKARDRIEGRS